MTREGSSWSPYASKSNDCASPTGAISNSFNIGRLELPPGAVPNREHPDRLSAIINLIYDPINVRLLAVEQVPQFPSQLSSFRSYSTTIGIDRKRVIPPPPALGTTERPSGIRQHSFPHKGLQDRGSRDQQTQCDMPCLRRTSSNTSLAGRVRPWATSSSPWRIPSSESARAAMSSRRW